MVETQLRPHRVLDPRLAAAMAEIPREAFVPARLAEVAYVDDDIEVAPGRFLMEPRVFGRLLQEAAVAAGDVVLDVGCGTGYSTAVLARLAATVVALEPDAALRARATETLARLGMDNAALMDGELAAGDPAHGPYNVIFLGGAVEIVPDALRDQLADGGRLAPVVVRRGVGKATIIERHGQAFGAREVFDAATPPLPGFTRKRGFTF